MAATCTRCTAPLPAGAQFCGVCGAPLPRSSTGITTDSFPDPLVGQIVSDRYRIVSLVGRGGMGAVYRAEHTAIGKPVAMKILHGTLGQRKEILQRFRREAEAASRLNHMHTVQVFDYGHWRGLTYLVMEFLRGQDLAAAIRAEGALTWPRAVSITAQVCESLAEAHGQGIVHRDLKPENILLVPKAGHPDFVKVVDFGLAKIRDDRGTLETTGDGSLLGTPFYMAPEQIRGEPVDGRTDVYAIGGVLYRCLTGLPPFEAPTPFAVLTRHLSDALVPPSVRAPERGIPPGLDAIVVRAMAKLPDDRFRSVDELRQALLDAAASLAGGSAALGGASVTPSVTPGAPFTIGPYAAPTPAAAPPPSPSPAAPPATAPSLAAAAALSDGGLDLSRDEFERYLRRMRARRWIGWSVAVLLLLAGGAAAVFLPDVLREPPGPRTAESEPNNALTEANRIDPGTAVTGTIGRRIDALQGDADCYRLEVRPLRQGVLRAEVTAIPGLDLRIDVFDVSGGEPIAVGNRGGPGEPEAVGGILVDGLVYLLRVSEAVPDGGVPSERISDSYRLTATVRPADAYEGEPNDDVETATWLPVGGRLSGYLETEGDRDVYCLAGTASGPVHAAVTPPSGLDVALEAGSRTVNGAGPGAAEAVAVGGAEGPCVVVRLTPEATPEGRAAVGPFEAYGIALRAGPPPSPPPASAPAAPDPPPASP